MDVAITQKYNAPALDKGLDILEILSNSDEGLALADIAKMVGKSPNQIYRMLDTLLRRGYITRKGDLYVISLKILMLANKIPFINRLKFIAEPLMREATNTIEQPCFLTTISNGKLVVIASCVSSMTWNLTIPVGTELGYYNTGTGRTILAHKPEAERDNILKSHSLLDGEVEIGRDEFNLILDGIKRRKYCHMNSETISGAVNLAFPIFCGNDDIIACITTPYLKRIDAHEAPSIEFITQVLNELSQAISVKLGNVSI